MKTVMKVLAALAAIAGAIYVIATYGEQIVAWCKKTLENLPKCPKCEEAEDADIEVEITVEETAEGAPAEEAAEEVPAAEEADFAPEAAEAEPVAEEADFAE